MSVNKWYPQQHCDTVTLEQVGGQAGRGICGGHRKGKEHAPHLRGGHGPCLRVVGEHGLGQGHRK